MRNIVASGRVKVKKISTEVNPSDVLTKFVLMCKFKSVLGLFKIGQV